MQQSIKELEILLKGDPYKSYLYSYPHKTAYGKFDSLPIQSLWKDENKKSLFLYTHIPFCRSKCGYCNLLSICEKDDNFHDLYVNALERQAKDIKEALSPFAFSRFAIGGGTPTILGERNLERLFDIAQKILAVDTESVPISVETSPKEASYTKLKLIKDRKTDRISIGIQSFIQSEAAYINRAENYKSIYTALESIKKLEFPVLNVDLIYGIPGQTIKSWEYSLSETLKYKPEEIYIYPLYVRPLTGLDIKSKTIGKHNDMRLQLYKTACSILKDSGYSQLSMRCFSLKRGFDKEINKVNVNLPEYSCQEDGMIGLGCGARSYTKSVHYSYEYGVSHSVVKGIIESYIDTKSYKYADFGFVLNEEEQKRRFVLKSLLYKDGIDCYKYKELFNSHVMDDFNELTCLMELGYAKGHNLEHDKTVLKLTEEGLALSDSIGPWLMSQKVRDRMERYMLL